MNKTAIVEISNKRIDQILSVRLDDVNITTTNTMQYVEVILVERLTFWKYVKRVSDKARNVIVTFSD